MKKLHFILLAVLVVLVALWWVTNDIEKQREKTFASGFPDVNTALIDTLRIYARAAQGQEVVLYRRDSVWRVSNGLADAPVHEGRMDILFNELQNLKPTRLSATANDNWMDMDMHDSLATRVIAMGKGGVLLDLLIGKFQYRDADNRTVNRAPPGAGGKRGITYVRLSGDNKVYSAEGFFGPNFNQQFATWRNQQMISLNPDELKQIQFDYGENHFFTVQVKDDGWYIHDKKVNEQSQEVYSSLLINKKFTYFADGFIPERDPLFRVRYQTGEGSRVVLQAFEANSGQMIIHSSQNPETYFLDYDDSLLDHYFPPLAFFFDPHVDYRSLVE